MVLVGFSYVVGDGFHDRAFLAVHGWDYTDIWSVSVKAGRHAFGGDVAFAAGDLVLARLWLFNLPSWFADALNLLLVNLTNSTCVCVHCSHRTWILDHL